MSFKFLKETPQTEDTGLDFGHKEIVSTLKNIVCNEDQNLTIGLFGSWGTGKSSIVETLKSRLEDPKIPLVLFDVWKHEGDALRRTFLMELTAKLETDYGKEYFKEGYSLNKRVTSSQNTSKEVLSFKKEKLKLHMTLLLILGSVFFAILLIVGRFFAWLEVDIFEGLRAKELIIAAMGTLSLTVLYKYIDYFIKAEKTEVKEERFQDPHEFEWEFSNIIENLCGEAGKIVITFDNLDRISGDNALKIISTIKTFLDYRSKDDENKKTVFFLIPCDVNSMKAHISFSSTSADRGDQKEQYWDEFLRKFFNTSIWIPEFYPTELEKFAIAKLTEVEVPEFKNDYLSWLIIKVFNKNPRQIIQFINILLSNYLLLKEFCENGAFHDRNFYKENIPQLAKFLLIKQRHAVCLEVYSESGVYNIDDATVMEKITDVKFKNLLHQTNDIYIPSLEPYFKYRMSQSEQENEKIVRFVDAISSGIDNPAAEAKEIDFKKDNSAFNNIVRAKLQTMNNLLFKTDLVQLILKLSSENAFAPDKALYRDLIIFFCSPSDWRIFFRVNPIFVDEGLLKRAPNIMPDERISIVNYFLGTLEREEHVTKTYSPEKLTELSGELFEFVVSYGNKLSQQQRDKVRLFIEENFNHPHILGVFMVSDKLQKEFISEKFATNLFENFRPELGVNRGLNQLEMMMALQPTVAYIDKVTLALNTAYYSIFSETNTLNEQSTLEKYAQLIHLNLELVLQQDDFEDDGNNFTSLCTLLIEYLKSRQVKELRGFFPLLLSLTKIERSKRYAISMVIDFFQQSDEQQVVALFEKYQDLLFKDVDEQIKGQVIAIIVRLVPLRQLIHHLPLNEIAVVAIKFAEEGHLDFARELIIAYRDKWDELTRQSIVDQLVQLFSANNEAYHSNQLFNRYVDLIFFATDNNAEVLGRSGFWNILGIMLTEKDPLGIQRFAYDAIRNHFDLLMKDESERLIELLLRTLNTREYDDDYLYNEALCQLIEKHPDRSYDRSYMLEVFRQIIFNSVTTNMFVICARAIEKMEYSIYEFQPDIMAYLLKCEQIIELELHNAKIVIKALDEVLKGNRSEEFNEIRQKLKRLK